MSPHTACIYDGVYCRIYTYARHTEGKMSPQRNFGVKVYQQQQHGLKLLSIVLFDIPQASLLSLLSVRMDVRLFTCKVVSGRIASSSAYKRHSSCAFRTGTGCSISPSSGTHRRSRSASLRSRFPSLPSYSASPLNLSAFASRKEGRDTWLVVGNLRFVKCQALSSRRTAAARDQRH